MPWAEPNYSLPDAVQRLVASSPVPFASAPPTAPSMPAQQLVTPPYQMPQFQAPDYSAMIQSMLQPQRSMMTQQVQGAQQQAAMGVPPATTTTQTPPIPAQAGPNRSQQLLAQLNQQGPSRSMTQGISAAGVNYGLAPNVTRPTGQ